MKERIEDFIDMLRESEKARLVFCSGCAFVIGFAVAYL